MKCSERLFDTCRRAFAEWRQMVWPNLLFGSAMILFSVWFGLSCVYAWEQPNGIALYAHEGADGRYALLFRTGKGQRQGLGRVKGYHEAEGMKLPARFKRVAVEGCAFWQDGQVAVYPASLMPEFESAILPILTHSINKIGGNGA